MDGKVIWDVTISLDGYIARPDGSPGRIFDWFFMGDTKSKFYSDVYPFKLTKQDAKVFDEIAGSIGAAVAGRRTYDSTRGWQKGFFLHIPIFVVTHKAPPLVPNGPTKFTFVTDGIRSAIKKAKVAAGSKTVNLLGANMGKQCIEEGLLDELKIHVAPFFLGEGVRLFDSPGSQLVELERVSVVDSSSGWTHLDLKVRKASSKGSYVEYANRT